MKRTSLTFLMALATCAPALWTGCGSAPTAGGSGAGNPSTMVAVTMYADTGAAVTGLAKGLAAGDSSAPRSLGIKDAGNLAFTVNIAVVRVKQIEFAFEQPIDCSDPFWSEHPALVCNGTGTSAVLAGPFEFDAMTGVVTPPLDSLRIPAAEYSHIRLWVAPPVDSVAAAEVSGTFIYQDTVRAFQFLLDLDTFVQINRPHVATFLLQAADTSHITIMLDASVWLADVDLNDNLSRRLVTLEQNGTLVLGATRATGAARALLNRISKNVAGSGVLRVQR